MPEKISLALGGAKKAAGRTTTNGIKRPHASLHDDDEAHQDDGRSQTVSHFEKSAGGAIDTASREKDQGPLVIAPQANRDWKEASKRRRQHHVLPDSGKDVKEAAIKEMEAVKPSFGLNVKERRSASEEPIGNENAHDEPDASKSTNGDLSTKKTDDELAMDALLGNRQKSELVLPAASEEEAFDRDYKSAPDVATLDDYARVPVEQFGAALLRGMGWKEGEGIGSQKGHKVQKTKVPERRPALLGIGAKEEAAVAQEMGAWGKAAKKGSEVKIYNPVLLRDKKTGELYTEEELQKKQEKEERRRYVEEFEKKERERERKNEDRRRYDDDDDSRDHRRDKERRRTIVVIGIGDVGTMVMIETGGGEATAMMSIIGAKRKTEGEERGIGMIVITTADGHDDITAIETGRGTEVKTADAEAGQLRTERKCFHKPI